MTHAPRRRLAHDLAADVGIGTMIVFIATILVAAIAAGVLISTSQKLQSKASQTGGEAIQNVASTLDVVSIKGLRSDTSTATAPIDELVILVKLDAGASPVDLGQMVIAYNDGTNSQNYKCVAGGVGSDTQFATKEVTGSANDCGVVVAGALVELRLGDDQAPTPLVSGGLLVNSHINLVMIPTQGTTVEKLFVTPPGYGAYSQIGLYP